MCIFKYWSWFSDDQKLTIISCLLYYLFCFFQAWRNNAKKDALKEIKEMMAVEKDTKVDKAKKEAECSEAAELSNLGDEISCVEDDVIVIDGSRYV